MKSPPRPQDETPAEATEARLRLYNTLTRRKEDFAPIDPNAVRLYVCGPTVYDFAHIGNARPVIVFDVLFRLLRHVYGADHVIYVRNITDVDDKINARAARDFPDLPLNEAIAKVTEATERQFHEDVAALGALPPTHEPRATQYIDTMRVMIERLIARGVAYVAEDHVLFSPNAMDALPGRRATGRSRIARSTRCWPARASMSRLTSAIRWTSSCGSPRSRTSRAGQAQPASPRRGAPAGISSARRCRWRRCSSRSAAACNATTRAATSSTFTAAGSISSFPITRTKSRNPAAPFDSARMANVWMHNGFLQVEGEKMSKSLGNFVTIHELLRTTKFGGRKWPGEVLRLAMLRTHYRQPIDWTVKALEEAEATLDRWYDAVGDVEARGDPDEDVLNALADDLNTPEAIARLHRLAHPDGAGTRFSTLQGQAERSRPRLLESERQSPGPPAANAIRTSGDRRSATRKIDAAEINAIIAERAQARAARNWAESDRLRDQLAALGVAIKDNKDGATTWELKR